MRGIEAPRVRVSRAIAAGIAGGALMALAMALARALGLPIRLELALGTLVVSSPGAARVAGLALLLALSAAAALAYALAFERLGNAGAGLGALLSIPHAVLAGMTLALLPALHPLLPERLDEPGGFLSGLGLPGVLLLFLLHAVYGAAVGALYRVGGGRPA